MQEQVLSVMSPSWSSLQPSKSLCADHMWSVRFLWHNAWKESMLWKASSKEWRNRKCITLAGDCVRYPIQFHVRLGVPFIAGLHGALEAGLTLAWCSEVIIYNVGCSPVNQSVSGSTTRVLSKACPLDPWCAAVGMVDREGVKLMSGRLLGDCFRNEEDDHECLYQQRNCTKGHSNSQSTTIHMIAPLGLRDGYEERRGRSSWDWYIGMAWAHGYHQVKQ